jgi:hypothetical protein
MAIDYMPQITPDAIAFLESIVQPDWKVFEWGSGQSTVFFARRVAEMVSVEHHPDWVRTVKNLLSPESLEITYLFREAIPDMGERDPDDPLCYRCGEGDTADWKDYVTAIETYPDSYFDLAFIDGGARLSCLWHAMPKVKPGGYILLDDSEREWYWSVLEEMLATWGKSVFPGLKGMAEQPSEATFWRKPCSY